MAEAKRHIDFCPSCANTAPQRVVYSHRYETTWYGESGRGRRGGPDLVAILCICETCDAPVLYEGIDPFEVDTSWPQIAYPKVADFGNEVPQSVQKIYRQATKCKFDAPLAFAILVRKALEAICDDRDIPKAKGAAGTLHGRLKELVARGDIPPTLAKMSDVLRAIGNTAAHDEPDEITVPMTWAIDEFIQAIIEYVYIAPAKLEKFEKQLARMRAARNPPAK